MASKDIPLEQVVIVNLDDGNKVVSTHSKIMEDDMISRGLIEDRYNNTSGLKAINIGNKSRNQVPQAGVVWPV